jgi:hypothetical protein
MIEVGTIFGEVAPTGVNERLFVRLIVMLVPAPLYGTVIRTGDQVAVPPIGADAGFNGPHVAVVPLTAAPQK